MDGWSERRDPLMKGAAAAPALAHGDQSSGRETKIDISIYYVSEA